jgi:hypothetical protein
MGSPVPKARVLEAVRPNDGHGSGEEVHAFAYAARPTTTQHTAAPIDHLHHEVTSI